MKKLIYSLIVLLAVACVGPRVVYDYDLKTDFSDYKTYNYYPEMNTGLSELDVKRLLSSTDSILATKGFTKSDTPQLYVNFKSKQYETPSRSAIGVGIGNGPISIGGSIPFGAPDQHIQLILDFVDVAKDELIWQAEADDTQNSRYTPENRAGFFNIMMGKVLSKYPPKSK